MLLQIFCIVFFILFYSDSIDDIIEFPCFSLLVCFFLISDDVLVFERVFYKVGPLLGTYEGTNASEGPHISWEAIWEWVDELFGRAPRPGPYII